MKLKSLLAGIYFLLSITLGCTNQSTKKEKKSTVKTAFIKPVRQLKPNPFYDEFAKIICGDSKKSSAKINASFYAAYSKDILEKLLKIQKNRLEPIKSWNSTILKRNLKSDTTTVFYPFSGGDFLHLNYLYPNANHYVMMAQESVGSIPNFRKWKENESKEYLKAINFILRDIYSKSYFITKNMIKDTKQSPVNGMLPILLWSVSKTGYEILNLEEVQINENGKMSFSPLKNGTKKIMAVRITFGNKTTKEPKTLIYYSCDISDNGIKKDKAIAEVLKMLPPSNCFIKSASYLLHYSTFSIIRTTILDKSEYLVQDDTGIPYNYLNKSKFKIELHGTYIKPVADFSENLFQDDLAKAYKSTEYVAKLPFSLGYHWSSKNQNQMVAIRIKK